MAHVYRAFLCIFALQTGTTVVSADLVSDVEKIRRTSEEYLSGPAYERIEKLPNISAFVIDMYATFGRLFLNGQLGDCEKKPYPSAPCVIRINGDRSAELTSKAATLLSEIGALKGESPFSLSLPNPTNDYDAGLIVKQEQVCHSAVHVPEIQEIFKLTWAYYGYLSGNVSEALAASVTLTTDLVSRCGVTYHGWVADVNWPWTIDRLARNDLAINMVLHDVGPGCEGGGGYTRLLYEIYASLHRFVGGDSNKCLQNFVIRYNDYNKKAYEALVGELHKYLFQDLTIYGLCAAFTNLTDDEHERRKAWVKEKLTTISRQLLKAREVLKETPPTTSPPTTKAPWAGITVPPYTEWWFPRQPQEDVPTSEDVHSIVTTVMKSKASGIAQLPGKERPGRYQGLIENVVETVKAKYTRFAENGSIEGMMYLPYAADDKDLLCTMAWPDETNNSYAGQDSMGASYFVKWTARPTPPEVLRSRITFLKDRNNEDVAWNNIFNIHTEDLCGQVRSIMIHSKLTRNGTYLGQTDSKESSGFTTMIAVRCTNEFVWYELGWRYYFAAATTASDYVVSRAHGEYSNSCGQLIFLP